MISHTYPLFFLLSCLYCRFCEDKSFISLPNSVCFHGKYSPYVGLHWDWCEFKFDVKKTSLAKLNGFNLKCILFPLCILFLVAFISPFLKDVVPSSVHCSWLHARTACCSCIIYSWAMRNEVRGRLFPEAYLLVCEKPQPFLFFFSLSPLASDI